ncbi:MAG: arabinofuranosidase catalytic domain-containing protein, partial [Cyclobacteriaceae bacterium]
MKTSSRSKILALLFAACYFTAPKAQAQNTLDRAGLTAANPAAAAYSLRQLSTTYGGPAIQVRRSSDNTTQNIGFDGSGNLDLASVLAFVGGGDGFVSIWYDQSGMGRNATQGTLALQPRIVTGGVVETQNGRPTLTFSGGQTLQSTLTATQATTAGNVTTTSAVFRSNTINSSLFSNGDGGANRYNIHAPLGDGITYLDLGNIGTGGRVQVAGAWNTGFSVGTFQRNGTQGNIWRNGVNLVS